MIQTTHNYRDKMEQAWISAAGLCGATVIGSILGFFIKDLPHKWNDSILGFCAGIMLAAATLGLIVPALTRSGIGGNCSLNRILL